MSIELIAGVVAFLLALIGGGAAWVRADLQGQKTAQLDRAGEDLADAEKRAEIAAKPPADRAEAAAVLRRLARRLRRTRQGRE